jgi:CHASE2 domain-containing sensor protein
VVALKVLACHGKMEEHRFDREIAVLKKIDSPWIVKCHDSGTIGNARYYVMDLVEGVHLDEYLSNSNLDLNGKLAIFQRVCRAVADAHAKGVIHRDLKPRNILIDAQGQPHILDFGICSLESTDGSSQGQSTITQAGDIIGTLKYMSPEQAWGGVTRTIDERSDLWALGVMLYEIVTDGKYPYSLERTSDKTAHEALLDRIRRELPRLPRLDHIPHGRDLEVLIERCLAWEPEQRIESARALAVDLARYCRGRRVKTKPLRMSYRVKRLAVGAAVGMRWIFPVAFVSAMGITLWAAAFLFNVGWSVAGHEFQRSGQTIPPGAITGRARDAIRIVGVFDGTVDAVLPFAAERGIEGVTDSIPTWRAVHGYLMERFAQYHPKVVVWDYYFRTPQEGDTAFLTGVRTLEAEGVPVVLASLTYRSDGTPHLSPAIVQGLGGRLRHGAIGARDMVERPGEFILAAKRDHDVIVPSLALTTLAATLHPEARLDIEWPNRKRRLHLLYEIEPGAYLRERDRIELTRVYQARSPKDAVQAGDVLGVGGFTLRRPEHWDAQTIPYERLLTCSNDELEELIGNKLIVIGDFRSARFGFAADRHRVQYGTSVLSDVPGCYLLADAFAGLLDRRYVKSAFPVPTVTFAILLAVALLGSVLPMVLARRMRLGVVCVVGASGRLVSGDGLRERVGNGPSRDGWLRAAPTHDRRLLGRARPQPPSDCH